MPSPKWAKKPTRNGKTVILTAKGWIVNETKELLVSCKQLATRMAQALGVTSVAFQATKIVLTNAGTTADLAFTAIPAFIANPSAYFPVASVTVAPTTTTKAVAATQQLTPTVLPASAINKKVTYTTSDAAKATVSATGLITAVATGTATITVHTVDGNQLATCVVTVS